MYLNLSYNDGLILEQNLLDSLFGENLQTLIMSDCAQKIEHVLEIIQRSQFLIYLDLSRNKLTNLNILLQKISHFTPLIKTLILSENKDDYSLQTKE